MLPQYIINRRTKAVISIFDESDNECSMIYEGVESFMVRESPRKIVETTFNYLGMSLDGAMRVSQHILQRKMKVPVVLSAIDGIALLNCRPVSRKGSIWIVTDHIEQVRPIDRNKSIIEFKGGQSVAVLMNSKSLQNKRNEAAFLILTIMEKLKRRTPRSAINVYEEDSYTG